MEGDAQVLAFNLFGPDAFRLLVVVFELVFFQQAVFRESVFDKPEFVDLQILGKPGTRVIDPDVDVLSSFVPDDPLEGDIDSDPFFLPRVRRCDFVADC